MKVFKICFIDGSERPSEVFDFIDLVLPSKLLGFVKNMIDEGRICEESVADFRERNKHGIRSLQDACELLVSDGYTIATTEL